MGKATVDLPDPLQQPPAPAAGGGGADASADDLLSQLAGDEIDRLLAEAETERPAPPTMPAEPNSSASPTTTETEPVIEAVEAVEPPPAVELPSAPADDIAPPTAQATQETTEEETSGTEIVSRQLDELFEQLDEKPAQPAASSAPAHPAAEPSPTNADRENISAKDLDQAIAQSAPAVLAAPAEDSENSDAAPASPSPTAENEFAASAASASAASASALPPAQSDPSPPASELATTPEEQRSLLDTLDTSVETEAPEAADGDMADLDAIAAPLPLYLKPLVWINAPFATLPQGVREGVGKVAVLTLVNAVAVLLYVLIFRR